MLAPRRIEPLVEQGRDDHITLVSTRPSAPPIVGCRAHWLGW
jgi:hypothetical protein